MNGIVSAWRVWDLSALGPKAWADDPETDMLIDSTLREGAQQYGTYLELGIKKRILEGLFQLGLEEIELGWAGQEGLLELAGWALNRSRHTSLCLWSPCREGDIRLAGQTGLDSLIIGLPVSDAHMHGRLGLGRHGLLDLMAKGLEAACNAGFGTITLGLEDISRADMGFCLQLAEQACQAGVARLRLSDSRGLLSPPETARLVKVFRSRLDVELAVHCHDDFGMATANAVSALDSGAHFADCSLLGLGERSGIAATEELAAYLSLKTGQRAYRLEVLRELCGLVAEQAGLAVSRSKAVIGEDIFASESGLHTQALFTEPALFEPFDPELVGGRRRIGLGGKSGMAALRLALSRAGMSCPEPELPRLLSEVRAAAWSRRRPLADEELQELARHVLTATSQPR